MPSGVQGHLGSQRDDGVTSLAVNALDEEELRSILSEGPWAAREVLRVKKTGVGPSGSTAGEWRT